MKKIVILGSTGSIGKNTVEVVAKLKGYKVVGIAAHANFKKLLRQAASIKPKALGIVNISSSSIRDFYRDSISVAKDVDVYCGEKGITEMVKALDADILVAAFSSSIGIYAIIQAIRKKMRLCLATKEILVTYGELVMKAVNRYGAEIIPVDSEHSALFQCLEGKSKKDVLNIILTASGGPFLDKPLSNISHRDVLKHPIWSMGKKITVDSATMMNKGLEVIEAHHLFGIRPDHIKVVIHPEAICHSCIQFIDGSMLCQLSNPDMKLPIQYALTAPSHFSSPVTHLDIDRVNALHFKTPNRHKFPCLDLAYEALRAGKSMPAVLNGANAEAVRLFLEEKIEFSTIPRLVRKAMDRHLPRDGGIEDYKRAEQWSRHFIRSITKTSYNR